MKLKQPIRIPIRITQKFRANPNVYKKFGLAGHDGVDYGCPNGTELFAPMAGKVYVGWAPKTWGLFYSIENDWGTVYLCHLKENYMSTGSKVMKDQLMGLTNNTGFSTGPHLHIGLRVKGIKDAAMKDFVDPLPYFKKDEEQQSEKPEIEEIMTKYSEKCRKLEETEKILKTSQEKVGSLKADIKEETEKSIYWQKEAESADRKLKKITKELEEISKENSDNWRRYKESREEIKKLKEEKDVSTLSSKRLVFIILKRWLGNDK